MRSPDNNLRAMAAFTGLALALRIWIGWGQDLWDDEVASLIVATTPIKALKSYFMSDPHPPLFFLILKPWANISQASAWLRLLPEIFGAATVGILYGWVRSLTGRKAAFLAALLLTFAPFHLWASTELRSHSLVALFVLAGVALLTRYLENEQDSKFLLIGTGCMLAAAWCHYYGLVAAVAAGITLLVVTKNRKKTAIGFFGILVVAWLPWMPFLSAQFAQIQTFRSITPLGEWLFSMSVMLGFASFPWSPPTFFLFENLIEHTWIPYLSFLTIPAALFWVPVLGRWSKKLEFAGLTALLSVLLVLFGSRFVPGFEVRYMTFLLPLVLALGAVLYTGLNPKTGAVFMVLLLCAFCLSDLEALIKDNNRRPDYSQLAALISKERGTALVYNEAAAPGFLRAAKGQVEVISLRKGLGEKACSAESVERKLTQTPGPYYQIVANENLWDPDRVIAGTLQDRLGQPKCFKMGSAMGISVCRFEPRDVQD